VYIATSLLRPALFGFILTGTVACASAGHAQTGNFELELNAAVDAPDGCQMTFVASNNTGLALTKASYEVAVFDGEGLVSSLFVFEFGELPMNKTRVVVFALPEVKCEAVSRMLVNRQDECESSDGPQDICMKALNANSRISSIPFGL
jgi:hypothetical protein